jgi:aspartate aminotransferase
MVQLLDGVPVVLPTDESTGFKITPEQLAAAITPRTVAIILNTPSNPTGIVYERSELEAMGRVLAERGLHLITDEIYERILYDGAVHVSPAAVSPDLREMTAVVNGVSKAFSMTGWRIGYLAAPRDWADPAVAMQSHLSGNPCSISQEATLSALNGDDATVRVMAETFARRRTRVLELLAQAPKLRVVPPKGAFYVFPDFSAYYGLSLDGTGKAVSGSQGMAEFLLDTAHVVLVPGDAFGSDRHLRISFACAETVIEEGLSSMIAILARLR